MVLGAVDVVGKRFGVFLVKALSVVTALRCVEVKLDLRKAAAASDS